MNEHKSFLTISLGDAGIAGSYELESYCYSFRRETNPDDETQTEPYCPPINVTVCGFPDEKIINWGHGVHHSIDVALQRYDKDNTLEDTLDFKDAVCMGMQVVCSEGRIVTKLIFHAGRVAAGDTAFDNRWRGFSGDLKKEYKFGDFNTLWSETTAGNTTFDIRKKMMANRKIN